MFDLDKLYNKHIQEIDPYVPVDPTEQLVKSSGVNSKDVIRLNANENPYGPTKGVLNEIKNSDLSIYPDSFQRKLRSSLVDYTGMNFSELVAGAGSDELIDLLFRSFVNIGDSIIDCDPTFGMYSFGAKIIGAKIESVPRTTTWDVNVEGILSRVTPKTKMIFLASPNNPKGNLLNEKDLLEILKTKIIVVVDETYFEFAGVSLAKYIRQYQNLVILRSFSKWAGIAGLRIGYMISNSQIIENIIKIKQPYNINVAAEIAAINILSNPVWALDKVKVILKDKIKFEDELNQIKGLKLFPSRGNFVLIEFLDFDSNEVYNELASNGIFVRKFSDSKLHKMLRFSIGTTDQMEKLISILKKILKVNR